MSKKPLILGIETSCDETAASIITENDKGNPIVLSNIVSSQVEVHKEFGGVVPELAARSHVEKIDWIVEKAIDKSGKKISEIDAVASTAGPGLIVCLSVGLSFGKAFAASINKPFIAVNHLEGHALSPKLNSNLNYPYLLLLISGGHSQFLDVQGLGKYKRLGTTIDDAKAFPKLNPTDKHTINPGPAVEATASIFSIFFPLSFIAFFTIKSIFSTCDRAANSGTTPPNSLWISTWLEMILVKTIGFPTSFSVTNEAAVSSQLDSIPRIKGFLLIQIVFINCTIPIQVRNKFIYE